MITVVHPGLSCTIQDLGRPGFAHLGVPHAGAANPPALRRANRLLGNPDSAAALEFLLGGFTVRWDVPARFAVTGAPVDLLLNGDPVSAGTPVTAPAGSLLRARRPKHGLRSYLGIAGGLDVDPVLGSRSTDTLSGLGPAPVVAGTRLPIGTPADDENEVTVTEPVSTPEEQPLVLEFSWGPRDDWITEHARRLLTTTTWQVGTETNRVAARLRGPRLDHAVVRDLPSEGLPLGAIQVPPSGEAIVHLANHPPTGGYPVVGVVAKSDVWRIGDARPGAELRLRPRAE